MKEIPEPLQKPEYRFCLIVDRTKIPFQIGWSLSENEYERQPNQTWKDKKTGAIYKEDKEKNFIGYTGEIMNFPYNHPFLLKHLQEGGNYGVIGGFGNLAGIDADAYEVQQKIEAKLPETLTIQSGGINEADKEHPEKKHYYFEITDGLDQTFALKKEKDNVGHIRWFRGQLVGATSTHETGNTYNILKNIPIAKITRTQLYEVLGDYIDLVKEKKEEVQQTEKQITELRIENLFELNSLYSKGGGKYQGKHPFHDSKTGWDFEADTNKNAWYCFAHTTGGGALELLAVKEGIIPCEDIKKGWLKEHFKEVKKICKEKYNIELGGIEEKNIPEVPSLDLIDFSKYQQVYADTNKHLASYNFVKEELALIGTDYYTSIKALSYFIESLRQPTIQYYVGTETYDNRIHLLFLGGAGTGKGMVKKTIRNFTESVECSGARINLEQLIGKKIKTKSGEEDKKGYFGFKALIVDESQNLITEKEDLDGNIMREIRLAMDTFGFNKAEKKLVDTDLLSYCPETRFCLLTHDIQFPPKFFDTGTYRRSFAFELKAQKIKENDLIANLTKQRIEKEFTQYVNQKDLFCPPTIHFTEEALKEITKNYITFIKFLCLNKNQRVRVFGKNLAFTGKIYFFRIVSILALAKNEVSVTPTTAKQGCFDTIQFLLSTIQLYGNKSNPTLSRDIWKTDSFEEAMLFEWLHFNKAMSKETSTLSIKDVQTKIGEYFGLQDRQAMRVYSNMKKRGLITDYKGQHETKCWLGFEPSVEGLIEFEDNTEPDLYEWLLQMKKDCF